jgi:hypothetical protein
VGPPVPVDVSGVELETAAMRREIATTLERARSSQSISKEDAFGTMMRMLVLKKLQEENILARVADGARLPDETSTPTMPFIDWDSTAF